MLAPQRDNLRGAEPPLCRAGRGAAVGALLGERAAQCLPFGVCPCMRGEGRCSAQCPCLERSPARRRRSVPGGLPGQMPAGRQRLRAGGCSGGRRVPPRGCAEGPVAAVTASCPDRFVVCWKLVTALESCAGKCLGEMCAVDYSSDTIGGGVLRCTWELMSWLPARAQSRSLRCCEEIKSGPCSYELSLHIATVKSIQCNLKCE